MLRNAIVILSHISIEYIANIVSGTKYLFSRCPANILSIRKNLSEWETHLDHGFSKISFTETWLNDSTCEIYGTNGYNSVENHKLGLVVEWHYS